MTTRESNSNGERRIAIYSDCEKYRYVLSIVWDSALQKVQFIGLNPSTATEISDDPTLRRVKEFARSWDYGGVVMTNIFAWRDTDPFAMMKVPNPIGEYLPEPGVTIGDQWFLNQNDFYLNLTNKSCPLAVAAWGNHGKHLYRGVKVKLMLPGLKCFKLTSQGHPWHPLYMKADKQLIPFN